jgi:DNA primase
MPSGWGISSGALEGIVLDTLSVKSHVDLLDLVSRDTRLRKIAGTRGGEFAGPCPACGGTDRFHLQPEQGLWMCRSCHERWSDAIEYVQWRDGLSFTEAVQALGGDTLPRLGFGRRTPPPPPPLPVPSKLWQARAEEVVRRAFDDLWSDRGRRARDYLHGRGLTDETLRAFVVGYIPDDRHDDPVLWGLKLDEGKQVWLPRGILIPWINQGDDEVWSIKIRRPAGQPKYIATKGSIPTIFGTLRFQQRDLLVLPEGEFDAMLLWQHVHDIADVLSLGAAGKNVDPRAELYLLSSSRQLVIYDADTAGAAGAEKLIASSPRMHRLELPAGQDITDFHLAGGDLRRLVTEGTV